MRVGRSSECVVVRGRRTQHGWTSGSRSTLPHPLSAGVVVRSYIHLHPVPSPRRESSPTSRFPYPNKRSQTPPTILWVLESKVLQTRSRTTSGRGPSTPETPTPVLHEAPPSHPQPYKRTYNQVPPRICGTNAPGRGTDPCPS